MLPNFQFSIRNFQSKLKLQIILIFSLFLVSIFYFLSSPTLTSAASLTTPAQTAATVPTNTNPDVPNTPHFTTQSTTIEIMSAIICQLSGTDPLNPKQPCLGLDQATGKLGFLPPAQQGGAIGFMGNMITSLYSSPIHTVDYFQNLAQNFGITKKTYAQQTGTGFDGLKPLMGLWTAFRNIVYLVFVIVFVVIGLAIMLRIKIDPRTVMTIQNQIPKIIVGILLVTFSYAIAGFLIDMMYTTIYITGNVIASANTTPKMDPKIITEVASAPNPFAAANRSIGIGAAFESSTAVGSVIQDIFRTAPGMVFSAFVGGVAGSFIVPAIGKIDTGTLEKTFGKNLAKTIVGLADRLGSIVPDGGTKDSFWSTLVKKVVPLASAAIPGGTIFGPLAGQTIGAIVGSFTAGAVTGLIVGPIIVPFIATLIIFLILTIALLTALFRLWFTLLMAYIQILLAVVLAPFWIIGGIVPGSPINISGWLKNMAANLFAFPIVIAMFLLGKVFQDAMGDNASSFIPPLIGDRVTPDAIKGFISLGIILITPNIITMLKEALKVPKTDTGIGKAIGAGVAAPGRLLKYGLAEATHTEERGIYTYKKGRLGAFGRLLGL